MPDNSKSEDKKVIKNQVSKILDDLCLQNESEIIEEDIIALFEDIMKLFEGREEEFLNFEELSPDAKKAIYIEIKNIIALLQQLRGAADKQAVMEMLSKNLVINCSKHSEKFKSIAEKMDKQEQKNLKRRFADAILLELYRQRQMHIVQNKTPPKKLMDDIGQYVGQISKANKAVKSGKAPRNHLEAIAEKGIASLTRRM